MFFCKLRRDLCSLALNVTRLLAYESEGIAREVLQRTMRKKNGPRAPLFATTAFNL